MSDIYVLWQHNCAVRYAVQCPSGQTCYNYNGLCKNVCTSSCSSTVSSPGCVYNSGTSWCAAGNYYWIDAYTGYEYCRTTACLEGQGCDDRTTPTSCRRCNYDEYTCLTPSCGGISYDPTAQAGHGECVMPPIIVGDAISSCSNSQLNCQKCLGCFTPPYYCDLSGPCPTLLANGEACSVDSNCQSNNCDTDFDSTIKYAIWWLLKSKRFK